MSYYNYGSLVIQDLKTLETVTLSSSGLTYKNSTTTIIPWSTIGTGGGGTNYTQLSQTVESYQSINNTQYTTLNSTLTQINTTVNALSTSINTQIINSSSANFSTIDSNISTLNIGVVKATTINLGNASSTVVMNVSSLTIGNASSTVVMNVSSLTIGNASSTVVMNASSLTIGNASSTVNAGYFTLSSTTVGGASNCLLDTTVPTNLTTQFSIGQSNAEEVYIGNGTQNKKVVIGNIANSTNQINIGNASSTVTMNASSLNLYGNIRINPDGNKSTTIGCATVPTIINTKLTVDGSAVNSTINIMTIKQNTGSYNVVTDYREDPFSITSPNSGTLSLNNNYYDNLTLGMGVDTTYNFAYINCAMFHAVRPIVIGGRNGGDTYIGYAPTTISKTETQSGGNLWVKGYVFPKGDVIFNNDGSGLRWGGVGSGVSRIVDDGTLRICTDDNMKFQLGSSGSSLGSQYMDLNTDRLYLSGRLWAASQSSYIKAPLYVNYNESTDGDSNIIFHNNGTKIYTDKPDGGDRFRFYLRNVNFFEISHAPNVYNYITFRIGITYNGSLSDIAEMFEWEDGNTENEKRVGYTVLVNEQGFIRKATMDDNPNDVIGVVSASAVIIGSSAGMEHKNKYLKDDFEEYILDASGNQILNPDFDETLEYLPRGRRKEWATIGICGKLIVRNGCPINPKWRLIGTRQTAKIYLA